MPGTKQRKTVFRKTLVTHVEVVTILFEQDMFFGFNKIEHNHILHDSSYLPYRDVTIIKK